MGKNYNPDIAAEINSFLEGDDWHFSFEEERGLFRFNLSIKGRMKSISYIVDVKEDEYIVYAISPISGDQDDPDMMAQLAEFITRANYGLKNGGFEMDYRDGEIRYRSYVDCDGQLPCEQVIKDSIYVVAATFSRYSDGILDVIFGGIPAKDAIRKCEGGDD